MCALWLSSTCRVCLASGREMYPLANTPLEETYERVTSATLVVEGRPCCVCGVCLSTLRRCRRFMDSAREANDALDRWSRDQTKPTERPLFSFTHSPITIFEITSQEPKVKQEIVTTENDHRTDILVKKIKLEITNDDDYKNTQMSDTVECQNTETINVYDKMVDIKFEMEQADDVKDHSKMAEDVSEGVSNVGGNQASSDEDRPLTRLKSETRVSMNEDTERDPIIVKSQRLVTPEHPGNTYPAASSHHHEGNTFSCTHCQTINRRHLKKQFKISTEEKLVLRKCDKCDYKSSYRSNFLRHLRIHSGEKPYSCDKCDYKCLRKHNLDMHYLRHNVEKQLSCSFCDYKCNRPDSLRQHVFKHTGEQPFSCDKCEFKSSRKTNLEMHLLTHNDKKQFACDVCDYETNRTDSFKQHVSRHTGEQPFLCDKCDYKCSRSNNLKRHLLTHKEHRAA